MLKSMVLVGLGGAVGSIVRYASSTFITKYFSGSFPLATFMVNMTGCLLIGLSMGYFNKHPQDAYKLLVITGFCGGFTTYSAFSSESLALLQNGMTFTAALYVALSIIIGIALVWVGGILGK